MSDTDVTVTAEQEVEAKPEGAGSLPIIDPEKLPGAIEALLLTADRPMPLGRMVQALVEGGVPAAAASPNLVKQTIEALNAEYERSGRAFRIENVGAGFRVMTLAEFAGVVASVRGLRESQKLSRAAVETLAIVAYRQPITRVEIESIRGAATGEVLRTLLEKRMVAIVGRAEELGRPMLYGTSKRFLEVFGLASIRDLPPVSEAFPGVDASKLKKRGANKEAAPAAEATPEAAE